MKGFIEGPCHMEVQNEPRTFSHENINECYGMAWNPTSQPPVQCCSLKLCKASIPSLSRKTHFSVALHNVSTLITKCKLYFIFYSSTYKMYLFLWTFCLASLFNRNCTLMEMGVGLESENLVGILAKP